LEGGNEMNTQVITDKLLDITQNHAEAITEQWFKAVSSNPRTTSFHSLTPAHKERLMLQAKIFLQSIKKLYFAEHPFHEVERILESTAFAQDACSHGVPITEAVYALVLMRRHLWLYAETQEMINSALDEYLVLESITRTLLIFDYAVQIVLEHYQQMMKKESHPVSKR
jgi:hypothetical protein